MINESVRDKPRMGASGISASRERYSGSPPLTEETDKIETTSRWPFRRSLSIATLTVGAALATFVAGPDIPFFKDQRHSAAASSPTNTDSPGRVMEVKLEDGSNRIWEQTVIIGPNKPVDISNGERRLASVFAPSQFGVIPESGNNFSTRLRVSSIQVDMIEGGLFFGNDRKIGEGIRIVALTLRNQGLYINYFDEADNPNGYKRSIHISDLLSNNPHNSDFNGEVRFNKVFSEASVIVDGQIKGSVSLDTPLVGNESRLVGGFFAGSESTVTSNRLVQSNTPQ